METGQTVVLLQLGSLYESLYDLLNQASNKYKISYEHLKIWGSVILKIRK